MVFRLRLVWKEGIVTDTWTQRRPLLSVAFHVTVSIIDAQGIQEQADQGCGSHLELLTSQSTLDSNSSVLCGVLHCLTLCPPTFYHYRVQGVERKGRSHGRGQGRE